MIYACEECGFLFRRSGVQTQCPFCEGSRVREATAEEENRFLQKLNCHERVICESVYKDGK